MSRRDTAAAACVALALVGIAGQFSPWWALIVGGVVGALGIAVYTLVDLRSRPDGQ